MTEVTRTSTQLEALAVRARRAVIELGHGAGSGGAHFGPALSLVEIMTVLYDQAAVDPSRTRDVARDRIILSKGHGSLALYTVLHEFGYLSEEILRTAEQDGTRLPGQPIRDRDLGIEFSSGSLGMGLGYGVGLALSARMADAQRRVFVVMGDGETNEGSVWEAAMAAAHFGLDRLTAVVDLNGIQSDGPTTQVMSFDHQAAWRGFGWDVQAVDGHDIAELRRAVMSPSTGAPRCILARTIKGKGVSFMEGEPAWHHGRMTDVQYGEALSQVRVGAAR